MDHPPRTYRATNERTVVAVGGRLDVHTAPAGGRQRPQRGAADVG